MGKEDIKIHIIGAGISGLIAAQVIEDHGYSPVILEASDRVGGRVKSDQVDGFVLDHGFQVLLTAYPAAKKYLDFKSLDLKKFVPGAAIFKEGKMVVIGDPLRDISLLFSSLLSDVGSFGDKIKTLKLNNYLKSKSLEDIFSSDEKTTLSYLQEYGFSEQMIDLFFKPFFAGIYLEPDLKTSSRMFEFVYKMFGEGYAALPKNGIMEIPKQLKNNLKRTLIRFNCPVFKVKDNEIVLQDGQTIESQFTIVAAEASKLIQNLKNQEIQWRSCDALYFKTNDRVIDKPLIGLIPDKNLLLNNIFYPTRFLARNKSDSQLLSVTVVKDHNFSREELVAKVEKELKEACGIKEVKFLKHYRISKALPRLNGLRYEMLPSETRLTSTIFLAGDTQLNPSLNAAMISGERAALALIETIEGVRQ